MNVKRLYILSICTAIIFAGCAKVTVNSPGSNIEPEIPEPQEVKNYVSFDLGLNSMELAEVTKAAITGNNFKHQGNQVKVFDYVTYDNSVFTRYFTDVITSDGTAWNLPSGNSHKYEWTRNGTHAFFGWLIKDASVSPNLPQSMFGIGGENEPLLSNTYTLGLPTTEMKNDTEQFDFLYSDSIIRTMEGKDTDDHSAVQLPMKHLFTAFGFGAENKTQQTITITGVSINNLTNKKSATLAFDVAGTNNGITAVTYTPDQTDATTFNFTSDQQVVIPANGKPKDILHGDEGKNTETNYFMWPQTNTELSAVNVVVSYKFGDYPTTYNFNFSIPQERWDAGKINHIDVVFADKMVEADVTVLPWEKYETDIDYSEGTILLKSGGEFKVDNENCIKDGDNGEQIILINTLPVTCHFTIETPVGSTWIVTPVGDFDAFEIINGSGTVDGSEAEFFVKPLVLDPQRDYVLKLNVTLRLPSGRTVSANDPVFIKNSTLIEYEFIIPKSS